MQDFHILAAEILQEVRLSLAEVDSLQFEALGRLILAAPRIFVAGKGRTGLQMQAFAMRLVHLGLPAHVVDQVTTPAVHSGDLLLIGSGSGRTRTLVEYASQARAAEATIALITAVCDGPLWDLSAARVRIPMPGPTRDQSPSPSIQPLGSRFEAALGVLFDVLVLRLMAHLHVTPDQMLDRHANVQ